MGQASSLEQGTGDRVAGRHLGRGGQCGVGEPLSGHQHRLTGGGPGDLDQVALSDSRREPTRGWLRRGGGVSGDLDQVALADGGGSSRAAGPDTAAARSDVPCDARAAVVSASAGTVTVSTVSMVALPATRSVSALARARSIVPHTPSATYWRARASIAAHAWAASSEGKVPSQWSTPGSSTHRRSLDSARARAARWRSRSGLIRASTRRQRRRRCGAVLDRRSGPPGRPPRSPGTSAGACSSSSAMTPPGRRRAGPRPSPRAAHPDPARVRSPAGRPRPASTAVRHPPLGVQRGGGTAPPTGSPARPTPRAPARGGSRPRCRPPATPARWPPTARSPRPAPRSRRRSPPASDPTAAAHSCREPATPEGASHALSALAAARAAACTSPGPTATVLTPPLLRCSIHYPKPSGDHRQTLAPRAQSGCPTAALDYAVSEHDLESPARPSMVRRKLQRPSS